MKTTKTKAELMKEFDELRTQLKETEKKLFTISKAQDKRMEVKYARLASFPQLNPNPVVEVDLAGRVRYSNPVAKELFPDLKKTGLNHPWLMDLEKISETLKTEARKTYLREVRIGDRWYQQTIHSVMDGTRIRIYGFDTTERKQAEDATKASEERARDQAARLQAVLDAAPAMIWIASDRECRYITGNRASYVFSRVPEGTDMSKSGRTPERLAHYRIFKDGVELTAREMPIQRVAASGQGLSDYSLEFVFDDGTVRSVIGNVTPVLDSEGNPNGAIAAYMDITAHREVEMKYSKILATALSGFWITDLRGKLLEVNDALCRMLGYTHEELLTLSIADVEADESPADVLNHIAALQQKKFGHFVTRHRRKDGSIIDVEANSTWLDIGEGQLACFMRDITEHKQAEQALQRSEKRYRSYIELTEQLGWTTNADGEVVEDIPSWRKFTGQSEEEIKGWGWSKVLHPDDRERTVQIWRNAVATKSNYEVEYRIFRHDGIYRHFLTRGVPVFKNGGNIQEWVGTCIDITERKQMEEELRRSRDELEIQVQERTREVREQSRVLESFFKFTITPFVILDRDCNFIRVNEAYAKACHREVSEFPGHNHFEFYPSDAKAKFEQVVQTKKPYVAISRPFSFPDHPEWGTTYWDWTLTPVLDDRGEVEYLVFSLEDVTKRKRAEETIKEERQRFNDVLEMLPAYLVLLAPDYHVPFANRYFRERFGESHGKRCFEYLFGRSEPCEVCETYTVLKTKAPHQWEWTGPDGRIYDVFDFPFTDTDGSTLILEMGIDITERKRAEEALRTAHQYNRSLIEANLDPLVTINPEGKVTDVNSATELSTGVSREQLIGSDFSDYFTEPEKAREGYRTAFLKGTVRDYPLTLRHTSGMITDVLYNATIYRNEAGEIQGVFAAARDITETKEIQKRLEATNMLLSLFVKKLVRKEYLDSVIELIQPWTGCRCVGIRILNEKDYIPYESYVGFNQEFWESENLLSVEYDRCACVRVVTGNPDPQDSPLMTPAGSFRCENTFEFVGGLSDEEKTRFRGVCIKNGFKSVAIVPIRYRDKIVGGIHIADENEGKVTMSRVQFIESVAPLIGEAINRFNLEEELKESEARLRALSSQLLTAQESERKRIAMELHDGIGQMLTAIKFKVENILQEKGKAATTRQSLEAVIPLVRETVEEVRRMQMDLHPSTLDDLGILATLGWFCREYQKIYSHIRIEKEIGLQENEVPIPLRTVIYRMTQEALNNIAKHGKADLVRLSLRKKEGMIEWIVEDNGMGFNLEEILSSDRARRGLGLNSMRERAQLSGGTFEIESTLGKGTTVRASWPL